jgi:hypothetical protein
MNKKSVNSPNKGINKRNPNSGNRIDISIVEDGSGRHWSNSTRIPFDAYIKKITSFKKSDFY